MGTTPVLGPLQARPLRPILSVPSTWGPGSLEPTEIAEIPRGPHRPNLRTRSDTSLGGAIVAGGGWPAPIRRTMSFTVLPRPQVPVNVVTGIKTHPNAYRGPFGRYR